MVVFQSVANRIVVDDDIRDELLYSWIRFRVALQAFDGIAELSNLGLQLGLDSRRRVDARWRIGSAESEGGQKGKSC